MLKIKTERKQKLDSLLFQEGNNSKAFKNYQVIRPESPPLSKDNGEHKKTLYLATTNLNYLDIVLPRESAETGNDSNDTDIVLEQIETDSENDVIIGNGVPMMRWNFLAGKL